MAPSESLVAELAKRGIKLQFVGPSEAYGGATCVGVERDGYATWFILLLGWLEDTEAMVTACEEALAEVEIS